MTIGRARAVSTAMLLLGAGVILLTFRDYGASWDEPSAAYYGELVLGYSDTSVASPGSPVAAFGFV